MYKDLKKHYWWPNMKREIAKFMANCEICQVKVKHQKPMGETTVVVNSGMKMGRYQYGFYVRIA
jgi:hypothetical protein